MQQHPPVEILNTSGYSDAMSAYGNNPLLSFLIFVTTAANGYPPREVLQRRGDEHTHRDLKIYVAHSFLSYTVGKRRLPFPTQ